jgi:phosphatidylglycerophosphatase A
MAIMPFFLIYAICVLGSIWVLSHCERIFHEKDPRKANLDELVAMPLCFWPAEIFISKFSQPSINFYLWLFLGFVIFRVFDILKPLGIRRLECLPGGLGIVMDDLAAAVATSGCLILLQFLL